jgi:hypothetical protein
VAHYILKYQGTDPPQSDLERIDNAPGITILDRAADQLMLLEASDAAAAALDRQLANWTVAKEVTYPLPAPGRPEPRGRD